MKMQDECDCLREAFRCVAHLCERYPASLNVHEKADLFRKDEAVQRSFRSHPLIFESISDFSDEEYVVFATLALLNQLDHVFCDIHLVSNSEDAFKEISRLLVACELFYAPFGGLLGYYKETVQRILEKRTRTEIVEIDAHTQLRGPLCYDFRMNSPLALKAQVDGLEALPKTAEVYTVGGAGERLGLVDESTKEPLPVASLLFMGKCLLEHLFRDLEAREYLYEKTYGTPLNVPVVLMTSSEWYNDGKIDQLLKQHHFFNKPHELIYKVVQPLVPLLDLDGNFALSRPGCLVAKPGGHGVLWRLLYLQDALSWLEQRKVEHLVIRQINNPLAGLDAALLQLVGIAEEDKKKFGFASIPILKGLTEGLNVLCVKNGVKASITNVEYTSFEAILKKDPDFFTRAVFAANTNILYANLQAVKEIAKKVVAPGLLINMKGKHLLYDAGQYVEKQGARLESVMQNIADEMADSFEEGVGITKERLSTFLNVHDREKLFSVTKRPLVSLHDPRETPEYCLYDWYRMTLLLFRGVEGAIVPEEQQFQQFYEEGPNFLFRFHPAFGPIWSLIQKKMSHVVFEKGSELEVELAEVELETVSVCGSLILRSDVPCGKKGVKNSAPHVHLSHVLVKNKGCKSPVPIKDILCGAIQREEVCEFILEEGAEVVAQEVCIEGYFSLHVPKYTRATLLMDPISKSLLIKKTTLN